MKTMSLGEVNISTTKFTYIKMWEEILQIILLSSLAKKKLKGSRTETEKEVSSVLSENHMQYHQRTETLIKNSVASNYKKLFEMKANSLRGNKNDKTLSGTCMLSWSY